MKNFDSQKPFKKGKASVLFCDVRTFTNVLEIFGPEEVTSILDELFNRLKSTVEKHSGKVDKLLGDGLLAVFWDDEKSACERNATLCAKEILEEDLSKVNEELSINLGLRIGISTGNVLGTEIGNVDSTIMGESVNLAARLESACKKFGSSLLVDEPTYEGLRKKEEKYGFRLIPGQLIRGVYGEKSLYDVSFDRFDEEYLENFNKAARDYQTGHYSVALSFFINAFSDPARVEDRALLQDFARNCFEKINQRDELFQQPEKYHLHSNIQRKQADFLLFLMKEWVNRQNISPKLILDIGCGTGEFTKDVASEFSTKAKTVGIDSSGQQVRLAKQKITRDYNVEYKEARIEDFSFPEKFDLIFSNSTMHWVENQERAYRNIRGLMKEHGILAVHQGHKGCYRELREVAEETYREQGFSQKFDDFVYPLRYHTKKSIKKLLNDLDFKMLDAKVTESGQTETLVDDFVEAGLLPYKSRLNDVEEEVFVREFRKKANALTHVDTTRLYFVATKGAE